MFWKRKEKNNNTANSLSFMPPRHIFIPPPPPPRPPKQEFETMLEILRDAEKYANAGEKDVSNATLKNLCEFIQSYVSRTV